MATFTGTNGNDTLVGTSGDDSFLPLLGLDLVSGGAGFDLLTVNFAALLGITATIVADGTQAFSGAVQTTLAPATGPLTGAVYFTGIEALSLTLSPGNDMLTIDAAPLGAAATLLLDAGAGFDVLSVDFSTLAGTIFNQAPNFLVTSNRGTYSGWDQFDITLGAGNNQVTTQTGADRVHALGGNDTINTGAGNDTIWSIASVDVINAGSGVDQWHGDFSSYSGSLGFAYDTSAGYGYVTNGTTLTNIEGGSIVTGSADDSFLLFGLGAFHVDGGAGEDWLTWDDTGDLGFAYPAAFGDGGGGTFAGTIANAEFANIERINAALGDGDNYAYVDAAPLASGATINLSGGLGYDILAVDFTAFSDTSFAMGSDGTIAANRGTWLNFEEILIALGAGANTVTTGTGNDAVWSAGGADTVDGGAGTDAWYGDYSHAAASLTFSWNGTTGTGNLSNGTLLTGFEGGAVETGAGDDTFQISGILPFDVYGGAGTDRLVRNDAGLVGANPIAFILSAGDTFYGAVGNGGFDGIEQLDVTFADDDNIAYVTAFPLLSGAMLTLDGGLGNDLLNLDLAALPGSVLTVDGGGAASGNRGAYRGFETYWIGLGGGANTLVTGSGNDTVQAAFGGANAIATGAGDDVVYGGSGNETVAGGAGFDVFQVMGAKSGYAITQDGLGGYVVTDTNLADGDDGVDRLSSVERVLFSDASTDLPDYGVGLVLTGTAAADNLAGTPWDDRISGLAGDDTLSGGDGADRLAGGAGDDRLTGGLGIDTADYGDAAAAVRVSLAITGIGQATGGAGNDWFVDLFENLAGSALADTLTGNALANRIDGGGGNDTIDGGTGADTLFGGAGNDTYTVDNPADLVIENVAEGTDTVRASANWTLADNVENLTLTGALAINGTGNALANILTGNGGANRLSGGDGNDVIDGGGGADTMEGGAGNDTYKVDNAADMVLENVGEGTDVVTATVSYVLSANVENLTLAGTLAINGTGNALANTMTGNGSANRLSGGDGNDMLDGAAGADTMTGGTGNDTYKVDNAADVIVENAGEGTDAVTATVSHTLSANVENLTLAGASAIDGTGNALANNLTGNAAVNRLYGMDGADRLDGGLGADTMAGGTGNDTYVVDDAGDAVIELAGEGTDIVTSKISYTLGANLENLTLLGTIAIDATGNNQANALVGNGAANLLRGLDGNDILTGAAGDDILVGGAGADTLSGGAGADTFRFDLRETAANRDVIQDFVHLADRLAFSRAAFPELSAQPAGALDPLQLALAGAASTAQHHFVYTQATGSLYYDADGVGGAAQVLVATLSTKPVLSAADFLLI